MFDRILVPIDGSKTSGKALVQAMALAKTTHGRIRLIHVVGDTRRAIADALPLMRHAGILGGVTKDLLMSPGRCSLVSH